MGRQALPRGTGLHTDGHPMTCCPSTHIVLGQDLAGGSSWVLTPNSETWHLPWARWSRIWHLPWAKGSGIWHLPWARGSRIWPLFVTAVPSRQLSGCWSRVPHRPQPPRGCPTSYFLPGVNCFGKCFANCITEGLVSVLGRFDQSCLRSSFQRPG